jgi:hypothetical protein
MPLPHHRATPKPPTPRNNDDEHPQAPEREIKRWQRIRRLFFGVTNPSAQIQKLALKVHDQTAPPFAPVPKFLGIRFVFILSLNLVFPD